MTNKFTIRKKIITKLQKSIFVILLLFSCINIYAQCTYTDPQRQQEHDALVALHNANPGNTLGWDNLIDETDCEYCNLPGVFCDFDGFIFSLQVSSNGLSNIPPELCGLDNLESLGLSSNGIAVLPDCIGNMTSLKTLSFTDNDLTQFPDIGNLINLEQFFLGRNEITSFPDGICSATSLTNINFDRNNITSIPSCIGNLTNLFSLNLTFNEIEAIPESICNTAIGNLRLSGNEVSVIPECIGSIPTLNIFSLQNNNLQCITQGLADLCNSDMDLSGITFGGNPISTQYSNLQDFCADPNGEVCNVISCEEIPMLTLAAGNESPCVFEDPNITIDGMVVGVVYGLFDDGNLTRIFNVSSFASLNLGLLNGVISVQALSTFGEACDTELPVSNEINITVLTANSPCDDGDPNTINDVFDIDCGCAGTPIPPCEIILTGCVPNATFNCGANPTNLGISDFGNRLELSNCLGTVLVSHVGLPANFECDDVNTTRTLTIYEDANENGVFDAGEISVSCEQNVRLRGDNAGPVFDNLPEDVTINSDDTVPPVATDISAFDNDDCFPEDNTEVVFEGEELNIDGCDITLIRTYSASDACNNTTTFPHTITIIDVEGPVFTNHLVEINIECSDELQNIVSPTATDNFTVADEIVVDFTDEVIFVAACGGVTERTYTATDACGNITEAVTRIQQLDTTSPVFGEIESSITLDCTEEIPTTPPTATDNCSEVTITFEDTNTASDECADLSFVRTWIATDVCGNVTVFDQIIEQTDTEAPTFNEPLPEEIITVDCYFDIPPPAVLTASDNCTEVVVELSIRNDFEGPCSTGDGEFSYNWEATDACGNSVVHKQIILITQDVQAPQFTQELPQDITLSCNDTIPNFDLLMAEDCNGVTFDTLQLNLGEFGNECDSIRTFKRYWDVIDACGNLDTWTQEISILGDINGPEITVPADVTIECGASTTVADLGDATAQDVCSTSTLSDPVDVITPGCSDNTGVIKRTWTATDKCGNVSTATQTITIEDTEAPTFNEPLPEEFLSFDCPSDVPPAALLTASDNCSQITVTFEEVNTLTPCHGDGLFERIWTATDPCGNTTVHFQSFVFPNDNEAPEFVEELPADITLNCGDAIPEFAVLTVTDCSEILYVEMEEFEDGEECDASRTITRVWQTRAVCGGGAEHEQIITILGDTEAPVFNEPLPENIELECSLEFPAAAILTASDNCGVDVNVTLTEEEIDGDFCNLTIERTWTATDPCGNTTSHVQIISQIDTEPPSVSNTELLPITMECNGQFFDEFSFASSIVETAEAQDNCTPQNSLFFNTGFDFVGDDCSADSQAGTGTGTMNLTIQIFDFCNNFVELNQVIIFEDTTPPTFNEELPAPFVSLTCRDEIPPAAILTASDVCSGDVDVVFEVLTIGSVCAEAGMFISRLWTATDACGNINEYSQTLSISPDGGDPVLTNPAVTISCGDPLPELIVIDNCLSFEIEITETTEEVIENAMVITREWTATDDCLNIGSGVQTITILYPPEPMQVNCYDEFVFNTEECVFENVGVAPTMPAMVNCYDEFVFNAEACAFENVGVAPTMPAMENCYDEFQFDGETCSFVNIGIPATPTITCPANLTLSFAGDNAQDAAIASWLSSVIATDECEELVAISNDYDVENFSECTGFGTQTVTFTSGDLSCTAVVEITFEGMNAASCTNGFFQPLATGTVVSNQIPGVTISGASKSTGGNTAMIFDSNNPSGGDSDLGFMNVGQILILSENGDSNDPDDDRMGGVLTFNFDDPQCINYIGFADIDEAGGIIELLDNTGSTIANISIPASGDGTLQQVAIDMCQVAAIEINFVGSGAITDYCIQDVVPVCFEGNNPTPPPACSGMIDGLSLNPQNGSPLFELTDGMVLCAADFESHDVRIRAGVSGAHESLKFTISTPNGIFTTTENYETYDSKQFWASTPGTYVVNAKLYSDPHLTGTICDEFTLTFTIEDCAPVCTGMIDGFSLNPQNGSPLFELSDGMVLCAADFESHDVRIRAGVSGAHESLRFTISTPNGNVNNTENYETYDSHQFWATAPGTYTINAKLYSDDQLAGTVCDEQTLTFTIEDCAPVCGIEIDANGFESGWGIWNDGGYDAARVYNTSFASNGVRSIRLRDNSGTNSSMFTDKLDLTTYTSIEVCFNYYVNSFDNSNEDFHLLISDNGYSFSSVEEWNKGDEFENNVFMSDCVTIDGSFTNTTRLMFKSDASANGDQVYIDDVVITGCGTGVPNNAPTLAVTSLTETLFAKKAPGRKVDLTIAVDESLEPLAYTIERSNDGINYEPILDYAPRNTDQLEVYHDVDNNPKQGFNYYRLKIDYADNRTNYYEAAPISFDAITKVFPNPAQDFAYVNMGELMGKAANIKLVSISGVELMSIDITEDHEELIKLDLANYQNGLYTIVIQPEGRKIQVEKVVINKNY